MENINIYSLGTICILDFLSSLCFVTYPNVYYSGFIITLAYFFYYLYNKYKFTGVLTSATVMLLILSYISYQPILATTIVDISPYLPFMVFALCATQIFSGFLLSYYSINTVSLLCIVFGLLLRTFIGTNINAYLLSLLIGATSSVYMLISSQMLLDKFQSDQPVILGYILFLALKINPIFRNVMSLNTTIFYWIHILLGIGIYLFYKQTTVGSDTSKTPPINNKDILSNKIILFSIYGGFIASFFYYLNITTIHEILSESKLLSNKFLPVFEQASAAGMFLVPLIGEKFGILKSKIYFSYINLLTIVGVLVFCTNLIPLPTRGLIYMLCKIISLGFIWLSGTMFAPHILPQIYITKNEHPNKVSIYCAVLNVLSMIIGNFGSKVLENAFHESCKLTTIIGIFLVIGIVPVIVSHIIDYNYKEIKNN